MRRAIIAADNVVRLECSCGRRGEVPCATAAKAEEARRYYDGWPCPACCARAEPAKEDVLRDLPAGINTPLEAERWEHKHTRRL